MANADSPHSSVRILVVDDFEPWRRQICSILATKPGLCVVGEAAEGLEAVQKAQELQPDVILLDIGLPKLSGIEAAKIIRERCPKSKIVFVTENTDSEIREAAIGLGASGLVVKTDVAPLRCAMLKQQPHQPDYGNPFRSEFFGQTRRS
jgi:DNA-binding NarL/FixJ family response regulator